MASTTVKVGSKVGLHARPAGVIANAASEYDSEVSISMNGGEPVDAASALMIMSLGADYGDEVTVSSEDAAAVKEISELIGQDLDNE